MQTVDRNRNLEGRSILVSGGAGDIGLGMARVLLARGASVTLLDQLPHADVQERIEGLAPQGFVRYVQADVTNRPEVDAAVASMAKVDVGICNAAISEAAPFLEITEDQWRGQIDVNLTGVFNTMQAVARRMASDEVAGLVLLTGSWVQDVPWPEIAAYSASKAGAAMLARSAARELATLGIRVNVIAPGIVNAGMAAHQLRTEPQYAARASKVIPLERFGDTEELGQLTAYMCSDEARYMTGSVVLLDGGCTLFQFDVDAKETGSRWT